MQQFLRPFSWYFIIYDYYLKLQTKAGTVNLKVPRFCETTFETAVIERYRRRESSVEESLIEMYLAGVSVRRVEDITQALWGTRVSAGCFPDGNSALMLAAARLRHVAGTRWSMKRYMSMKRLEELKVEATAAAG